MPSAPSEGSGSGAIQRAKLEAELAAERRHAEAARARQGEAPARPPGARAAHLAGAGDPAGPRTRPRGAAPARARPRAACGAARRGRRGRRRRRCRGGASRVLTGGVRAAGRAAGGERGDDRAPRSRPPSYAGSATRARRSWSGWERPSASSSARRPSLCRTRSARRSRRGSRRLQRNREQIGPVNPLAKREYEEAREHVTELAEQRKDLEKAITRAARADPPHRQGDRGRLRGDLRGDRPRLRGDGGGALPGRSRPSAPRGRRQAHHGPSRGRSPSARRATRTRSRGAHAARRGRRRRDRGDAGRQVDPPALAALRRREVPGRPRLRLRRADGAALSLLHPRRGRGRPRRHQHRPLPAAGPPLRRALAVHRRHPPEADDGRRRHPLRRQHGRRRHHQGRLAQAAARRAGDDPGRAGGRRRSLAS